MHKETGYNTIKLFQHYDSILNELNAGKPIDTLTDDENFELDHFGSCLAKSLIQDFNLHHKPDTDLIIMAKIILAETENN